MQAIFFIKKHEKILLASCGGVLLGLPFIFPSFWPLSFLGIVLLIRIVTESSLHTFLLGWLAGFVLYGFALYGVFFHTLPLDWMGIAEENLQRILAIVGWTFSSLCMGLAIGGWALSAHFLSTRSWRDVFIIPSLWILAEVFAAFSMYALHHGPGNIFGTIDFSLGFIGYHLAEDVAFLQAAWVGGVFALSAIVVLIGSILFRIYHSNVIKEHYILSVVLALTILSWIAGHTFFLLRPPTPSEEGVEFALLATTIVYTLSEEDKLLTQERLIEKARRADIVVLPEGAEFFRRSEFLNEPRPNSADFYIDSSDVPTEGGATHSSVEYYDPKVGVTQHTYKHFLLPVGEFVPYLYVAAGKIFGFSKSETFQKIIKERSHKSGPIPMPIETPSGARVGVLFCNESMSPFLYRSLGRGGADVFVNIASHLWFNRSKVVFTQMLHTNQVRAVENRRWLVQANNTVPALVLDAYGRVVAETSWDIPNDVLRVYVPRLQDMTPYMVMGPWVLIVPVGIILFAVYLQKKRRYTILIWQQKSQ